MDILHGIFFRAGLQAQIVVRSGNTTIIYKYMGAAVKIQPIAVIAFLVMNIYFADPDVLGI